MPLSPIGPLNRVDETLNATNQAGDHNLFQQKVDALVAAVNAGPSGPPLPTMLEAFAGVTVQPRSLERWLFSKDRVRHVCCVGDSTTQGNAGSPTDPWFQRIARVLGNDIGPLVGYGFRGTWLGLAIFGGVPIGGEWAYGRTILASPVPKYTRTVTGCTLWGSGTNKISAPPGGTFSAADTGSVASVVSGPGTITGTGVVTYDAADEGLAGQSWLLCPVGSAGPGGTTVVLLTRSTPAAGYTNATNQLTANTGAFYPSDVGSIIAATGIPVGTTIVSQTGTAAVLSAVITTAANTPTAIDSNITWVKTNGQAFDVAPFGECYFADTGQTEATALTWTIPAWMVDPNKPIVAFDLVWADGWTGGSGWQWSVDDGATWNTISNAAARLASNTLKKTRVVTPITKRLQIRATNGSTPVDVGIAGIIPWTANPTTASGIMVHMIGRFGLTLGSIVTGGADRMALLDSGATHPAGLKPCLTLCGFINDPVVYGNTATWTTHQGLFDAYVNAWSDILWWSHWEANSSDSGVMQAAYRATTKVNAATFGWGLIDLYDAWSVLLGITAPSGTNAAFVASGLVLGDLTHESQVGHEDMAARFRRVLSTFS